MKGLGTECDWGTGCEIPKQPIKNHDVYKNGFETRKTRV